MRRFTVGVMGAGEGAGAEDLEAAYALGRLLAERRWAVLTGGRDAGVMRAVNAGAKTVPDSLTIGILPSAEARPSSDLDVVIVTDMGAARNNINVLSSDVVIACGRGGPGTASEIALALKAGKPVILLRAAPEAEGFFKGLGGARVVLAATPAEAVAEAAALEARMGCPTCRRPQQ
jgi:uncharacterized protein (TIGR00725 family)